MIAKRNGYTLIEIMIALAVFAILSTITASALYNAFNTRARVSLQADQLNIIQLAIAVLKNDTEQIIDRSVHVDDIQSIPAFVGQPDYVEFTRGGIANPNSVLKQSTLKRIAYLCLDDKFIRRSWESLDTPNRQRYQDKIVFEKLKTCSFAYLSRNRQVLTEWRENALQQTQQLEVLPIAIQLDLTIETWGNTNMLFIIPRGLYGE